MRKRLYDIIDTENKSDRWCFAYNIFMMIVIIISIIPLAFKTLPPLFVVTEFITVSIFIVDYLCRWITADYKLNRGILSFVTYPFTPMAIIDLLSILPSITLLNNSFKLARILRLFRIFRVFKLFKYSPAIQMIINVFKKQKYAFLVVLIIAISYILIAALIILNIEPNTFDNFYEAVYWACVSLTTVGYGDIYPVTIVGRMITMISSFMGIAVVALPAGIITSGMITEINNRDVKRHK